MKIVVKFIIVMLGGVVSCQQKQNVIQNNDFAAYFKRIEEKDTLLFEIEDWGLGEGETLKGDSIPTAIFYQAVKDTLLAPLRYLIEIDEPKLTSLGRFSLDSKYDAFILSMQVFWFKSKSLLLWDNNLKKVIQIFPVATFYGGDGGQILEKSWLIKQNTGYEWVKRLSEHTLNVDAIDEKEEHLYENQVSVYTWKAGTFQEIVVKDSAAFIQQYPVIWNWE